ncbi:serine/threonine-protein kinase [Streptodolium elevatio]|uniref:non-specific serine/threonine protein kinase n=1 Tax=Streptodolium elevatio TaxID=3157996 RepID=A0ABV3DR76_9ACTN
MCGRADEFSGAGLAGGRVLAGRYQLEELLGRGGMGEVWAAVDARIARRVAVKVLPSGGGDPQGLLREARTAGALSHPGIVTVHDLGREPDGTVFVVMELVAGRDLARVLHEDGMPAVRDAVEWSAQCADALAAAHDAGIVHRDLKPANVLLTPQGTIKVVDFGIARYTAAATRSSRIVGTPAYIAPERFSGESGDGRVDLYALGCMLYELICGRPPFTAPDPMALMYAHLRQEPVPLGVHRADLPPGVAELAAQLLAKDPGLRPASAHEVWRRLRALPLDEVPSRRPGRAAAACAATLPGHAGDAAAAAGSGADGSGAAQGARPAAGLEPTRTVADPDDARWDDFAPVGEPARRRGLSRRSAVLLGLGAAAAAGTAAATYPWGAGAADSDAPPTKWEFVTGGGVAAAPVADGSVVYVASDDGNLYAVHAASGSRRWVHRTGGDEISRPTTSGEIAYVRSGKVDGSGSGALHAVDASTGAALWSYPVSAVGGAPTVADGVCYVGGGLEPPGQGSTGYIARFHAVDARGGRELWTFAAAGAFYGRPTVVDGVVYTGCMDGNVYAIDAATGSRRWAFRTGGAVRTAVVVTEGTVYAASYDTNVYAIDAAAGTQRWAYSAGAPADSPALEGDVLVVGGENVVHAVNRSTGTPRWTFAAPDLVGAPALAHGRVHIGCGDGRLYGIEMTRGTLSWSFRTHGAVYAAPAVTQDAAYVASLDKKLYALDFTPRY